MKTRVEPKDFTDRARQTQIILNVVRSDKVFDEGSNKKW